MMQSLIPFKGKKAQFKWTRLNLKEEVGVIEDSEA